MEPFETIPCPPTTRHEVGFESTAALIAQQQLNDARKAFLASATLPANHDFRERANEADGSLLPTQPNGAPRKTYEHNKIPKPRTRTDKEAATYILERHRLVNMWNGKWTNDSDWEAWDRAKEKMEKQFGSYRLVEQPLPVKGQQTKEHRRRDKKRQREESSNADIPSKKHCCKKKTRQEEAEILKLPLLTPEDVLATIPAEGIRMELLLAKFWQPDAWDTERFCTLLHEIGTVNKFTKMFTQKQVEN